jgi:hypothetical protein
MQSTDMGAFSTEALIYLKHFVTKIYNPSHSSLIDSKAYYVLLVVTQREMILIQTFRDYVSVPSSLINLSELPFFDSLTLETGPTGISETSVPNHLTLRYNPEDGRFNFNRSGSLRSRKHFHVHVIKMI